MEYMLMPLKRYADFEGRSRRMEYWMFALGILIVEIVLFVLMATLGGLAAVGSNGSAVAAGGVAMLFSLVLMVLGLALIVPSIAVGVRRFHDQDQSGWMLLLGLIPFVGGLILIVFMCLPGTAGPNRFGPDPLAGERDALSGGIGMGPRPDLR